MQLVFFFKLFLITSCNSRIENKKIESHKSYIYKDSLGVVLSQGLKNELNQEEGYWEYYDSIGNITERGEFHKGLLFDKWAYNLPDFKGNINWEIEESNKLLKYNFPSEFKVNMSDIYNIKIYENYSKFSISIITEDSIRNLDDYKLYILNNVKKDCISLKGECNYIESKNVTGYFLHFYQEKADQKNVVNTYVIVFNNKIYEIRMDCKVSDNFPYQYYMTIFINIVTHLYVDNIRVIDPSITNTVQCDI